MKLSFLENKKMVPIEKCMKYSITVARNRGYTSAMITNIKFYKIILIDLNPMVTITNPLKESKNLAEKLGWLVLVD
jgi:hypothetical protein